MKPKPKVRWNKHTCLGRADSQAKGAKKVKEEEGDEEEGDGEKVEEEEEEEEKPKPKVSSRVLTGGIWS